jgi:hypothetical protein
MAMKIVERGILFDASAAAPESRFCTFTTLERLDSGRLLAGFRTGSAKDSADESIRIMASDDDGATWQTVFTGFGDIPPGSGGRLRAVGFTETDPGRLIGVFMWMDRSDPNLPLASPETQGILPTKMLVAESEDGGHTWGPLREVSLQPHKGNALTGNVLALRDGGLALPYEAWKEYHDTSRGQHHAALRLSDDGGQTWTGPQIVAHDDQGRLLFWDQRLAANPEDGRLIAMFWTHDREAQEDVAMHVAWGSPDGRSWTAPVSTGITGQICAPLWLPGGRVFAAYVHRHHPPSLRAILSPDAASARAGQTWSAFEELVFYEKERGGQESGMGGKRDFGDYWADMSIWTFGHPAAVVLEDPDVREVGDVLVAYYAGDETSMSIHWARIDVSR